MVRFGIVGLGNMGTTHGRRILDGEVPGAVLKAVCDRNRDRLKTFPGVEGFTDHRSMFSSGLIDAVIIATHHYVHTPVSIDAVESGVHFLVEKPLGVHKADCEKTIAAYESRRRDDQVFALMLNQRTRPVFRRVKSLLQAGELGRVQRFSWTITDWFRPEVYYASGGWRATWKGEGGGVLLNQCPHQLDLLQWFFGMPETVRAFGGLGKYHDIEVEDEVTAYMEFPGGTTGVFIASTGEAPGINRLEIAAERGLFVVDSDGIRWTRNERETRRFSKETNELFSKPETWDVGFRIEESDGDEHSRVLRSFVDAIEGSGSLVAEGAEGVRSVELGNAMLYSLIKDETVRLPLDGAAYQEMLEQLIAESRFEKKAETRSVASVDDMSSSF